MTVTSGDGPPNTGRAQMRGFLFADIRGYTSYVEQRGAAAAADLLLRYRAIVRQAIERHAGAEIRTEGDSFYVVLQSASDAVRCGLAIVDDVASANREHPDDPIRVGVGIHAGEAIETQEGLVGSAVNVAARVCALAGPGEVLVTDTVRSLTRSVISAPFTPRGRHRLKGVGDDVALFAVAEGSAPRPRLLRGRAALLVTTGVAIATMLIVALGYFASHPPLKTAASTGSPGPTATVGLSTSPLASTKTSPMPSLSSSPPVTITPTGPLNAGFEVLAPGTYSSGPDFRPPFTFQIDPAWTDRHWWAVTSSADDDGAIGVKSIGYVPDNEIFIHLPRVEVSLLRLRTVRHDICDGTPSAKDDSLGPRPEDFATWLSSQQLITVSNEHQFSMGSRSGLSMDASITGDTGAVCAGIPGYPRVTYPFETSQGTKRWWPGQPSTFIALDSGDSVSFVVWLGVRPEGSERNTIPGGAPPPSPGPTDPAVLAEIETMSEWGQDLISTFVFTPNPSH